MNLLNGELIKFGINRVLPRIILKKQNFTNGVTTSLLNWFDPKQNQIIAGQKEMEE